LKSRFVLLSISFPIRSEAADLKADPGKIFHARLEALLKDYLSRWRPVLLRNLGDRVKFDVVFTNEKFGPGADACYTLFPGFWGPNQGSSFVGRTFQKAIGCSERAARTAMSKAMDTDALPQFGVSEVALAQNEHHSVHVRQQTYRRGSRNTVNEMQGHVLGWNAASAVPAAGKVQKKPAAKK